MFPQAPLLLGFALGMRHADQRALWNLLSGDMDLTSAKVGDTIHKLCNDASTVADTVSVRIRNRRFSTRNESRKARQGS